MNKIRVGGITKFTTIDFPGKLAAVLFLQGCPYRCPYCHNKHLQSPTHQDELDWDDVLEFLDNRKDRLDGVVFSGGEPLMQPAIKDAIKEVKALGYDIALHTSGHNPKLLGKIIDDIDWVGLDIKTKFDSYQSVTNFPNSGDNAKTALKLIIESKTDFEVRTTMDPTVVKNADDLLNIAQSLSDAGVKNYILQEYRPIGREIEPSQAEIKALLLNKKLTSEISALFDKFEIRN